jgi:hypothetical protein
LVEPKENVCPEQGTKSTEDPEDRSEQHCRC